MMPPGPSSPGPHPGGEAAAASFDNARPRPTRRFARAAAHFPRRMFHADGARESGLAALSYTSVANFAVDAMLAVALAHTLFFSAATAESRTNVALYLAMTVAPFAVVAPVIGPALDRLHTGRRFTLSLSFSLRAVLAVTLALNFESLLLYPLALGMLVLSKTYGVVRASMTPQLVPPDLDLVRTNSRLTVLGHVFGSAIGGGIAAAISWLFDSRSVLWLLALVALAGAYLCMTIPRKAESQPGSESASLTFFGDADREASTLPHEQQARRSIPSPAAGMRTIRHVLRRPLGRGVLSNLWAESSVRMLTGFLTLFIAFVAKSTGDAAATEQAAMLGAAGAAAAIGTFSGNALGARIPLGKPERITLSVSAAAFAGTVLAALFNSVPAAVVLSLLAALTSALGKVALDSSIQTDIAASARSSAFGRSETALQLSWVLGGALGVLLPTDFRIGFATVAVVSGLMFAQAVLTRNGRSLLPALGGNRPA